MKKTVLITGASSGFGLMLANSLHQQGFTVIKTNLGHNAVSAQGRDIADYNTYRKQAMAATQKGIDEAEAPDAVIKTISALITAKKPKFSNPVGKMSRIILFLQQHMPKIFEGEILKSVKSA
ncbi:MULTISPECIES: hypothetical protein [unclassified Serratia (in: enterobacteria)]|uniref:hypothetical protein n=1 Tax=unclassified Serratia (in: enterobacteria) TaxID=2647522 RepID=UPI002ED38864|nr:hypothetical protein [Serratia sp. C2(2)]MEE4446530.1 hypothetical protein [Serratia sp. C2(1)]